MSSCDVRESSTLEIIWLVLAIYSKKLDPISWNTHLILSKKAQLSPHSDAKSAQYLDTLGFETAISIDFAPHFGTYLTSNGGI